MKRKAAFGIMLILLVLGVLPLVIEVRSIRADPTTWTVDDDGPANFSKIQDAINAASPGDTISVHTGTYYENVVVNKTVLLVGENKEYTIIDGSNTDWEVLKITANSTVVSGFTARNSSWFGIQIWNSSNNTIKDMNVIDTFYGIRLDQSTNNSITGNTAKNNRFMGILLGSSSNNVLRNNEMANNPENFGVWGISISDFINDVDASNIVDGKPVCYWINQHDRQIPIDTGVAIVVNSSKITAKNLTLRNNDHGIYFVNTSSSFIEENMVTDNTCGIDLFQSFNNTLSGNVVLANSMGISMRFASDNNIVGNNSVVMSGNGVYLYESDANRIIGNTIRNSQDYGIDFHESEGNSFYHNNLISNQIDVCPYATGTNFWDDGYPSGGNYWSDRTDVDLKMGPYQSQAGSDGLGDTPYVVDADNRDRYPLMGPFNTFDAGTWNGITYNVDVVSNSTVLGFAFNVDQKLVSFNVTGLDGTVGFSRVTIPSALLGGPYVILVNDSPPITTNEVSNGTHTFLYFTYKHSTRQVDITGATAVPEFPLALILLLLMALTKLAVIFSRKTIHRKLKT